MMANRRRFGHLPALDPGAVIVLLLTGIKIVKCEQNVLLHPNVFDDQYICCPSELQCQMQEILKEELQLNPLFKSAWSRAIQELELNNHYISPYTVAWQMFMMDDPEVIDVIRQFHGNVSVAGESRDFYMNHFHFKGLHFYLTRYLQYRKQQEDRMENKTFRLDFIPFSFAKVFRFDKFITFPKQRLSNTTLLFKSYFGILLGSVQEKVVIPVSETYYYIGHYKGIHHIQSTGQKCSYYNCALTGGVKRQVPVCNSDYQLVCVSDYDIPCNSALCLSNMWTPFILCLFILTADSAFLQLSCT